MVVTGRVTVLVKGTVTVETIDVVAVVVKG